MPHPEPQSATAGLESGELLEELAWLQGLARRLVGDRALAEDLVQETWLAGLRRFGRGSLPPRDWLLSRLRSSAWNRRRSERRRARREEGSARRDAEPSAGELVLRSEAQRTLLAAVLELPEELRDPLLMRFSGGLSVTEIAARQGCAKSTASGRIERGLQLLRERLGAAGGGAAWSSCLSLASLPGPALPHAPHGLWSTFLLSKYLKLVAATAALLLVIVVGRGGIARLVGGGGQSRSNEPQAALVPSLAQAPNPAAQPREPAELAPEPARRSIDQGTPPAALTALQDYVLSGTVTHVDGAPFPGVAVRMLAGERERKRSLSQADGSFELRLSPKELRELADASFLRARIVAAGDYERREVEFSDSDNADYPLPRSGSTDRLAALRLPPASGIEGRVRDERGAAVAGATVWLSISDPRQSDGVASYSGPTGPVEAQTDDLGAFQLLGVPPGDYLIEAEHRLYEAMRLPVSVSCALGERTRDVELELHRAQLLTGRVEDAAGQPLPDVYVIGVDDAGRSTVQSGPDGRFELPLRTGGPVDLQVYGSGRELVSPSLERGFSAADSSLVIVMRPLEATTVFQLIDALSGEPVTSAACELRVAAAEDRLTSLRHETLGAPRERPDGLVRSQAVDGEDVLLVEAPGYARHAVRVAHTSSRAPHQFVELEPAGGLRGRAFERGVPLGGARVRLHGARFRLNKPRLLWRDGSLAEAPGSDLQPSKLGYTVYGHKPVVGLDGPPPTHRYLPWSGVLAATRTDAEGRFAVNAVVEGPTYLSCENDAGIGALFFFEGEPTNDGQDLGDLRVPEGASVSGFVDLGGAPRGRRLRVEVDTPERSVEVSASGEFHLTDLPPGDLYLDVEEVGARDEPYLAFPPSFHLRLLPGEERRVVLPLAGWLACRLEASVTLSGRPCRRGAKLLVRPTGSGLSFVRARGATDSKGRIEDHLAARGLCDVQLHLPQTGAWPVRLQGERLLDLQPGALLREALDFPSCRLTLSLRNAAPTGSATHLDLALEPLGGELAPQTIRHIRFAPSAEDAALWSSAPLEISPGEYTASLESHLPPSADQAPPRETLARSVLRLPPGGELSVELDRDAGRR
ncbi:MAG: sigma-70 family RNA polymerase sigma factor [Planctomycetota bacterium]